MPSQEPNTCHLLHTCKVALPEKGGIQIVANQIFISLANNFKSTLLSTRNSNLPPPSIKNLNYVLKKPLFEFKSLPIAPGFILSLWKLAKTSDAFVVHYPFPLADIAIGLFPGKFKKIIVYWHSDIFEQKFLKKILFPFTNAMLKNSSVIVVSSPKLIEHSQFLKNYQSKCVVIPFGFSPDPSQEVTDNNYYLCIGRHVKYKGINHLIKAVSKTQAKVKIVGTGPLLLDHKRLATELKISDRIEFIEDASDSKIMELISQCRALILPSISPNEAFGLVQIEAMAYGKPIINTNLPSAVPWVARDKIEAITVNPGSADEIAAAINQLEHNEQLREELAKNALQRWQSTFNLGKFHSETQRLFNDICYE